MRSRGFALIPLLPYIIGGIAVASLAGWLWWQFGAWKDRLREEGRVEVRAEWQAERAELIAARDAMVLRWATAIQTVERVYVETVVERQAQFTGLRERATGASYNGTIRLSPDAIGVLRDSTNAANAADPGPAPVSEVPAEAVPVTAGSETDAAEWVAFAVDAAESYADAREKWQACVSWAGQIREANADIR